jgi:hypothetical protein
MPLAISEKVAVPLSAATTRYGIIPIVAHNVLRCDEFAADDIVGDIEQATQECLVAGNAFSHQRVALGRGFTQNETHLWPLVAR